MLFAPYGCDLTLIASSLADGTRPAASNGTSVTPAQNAWGSWATAISAGSITRRVHKLGIIAHNWAASGASRNAAIQIGWDPAGGTSFAAWCTILIGPASVITNLRAVFDEILVDFPAGSTIGVRASVDSATLTAGRVIVDAYGSPSPSHLWPNAGRAQDVGFTLGSTSGVAVTPGTTSEGAWAEIGGFSADNPFAYSIGVGVADAAVTGGVLFCDVGIGTGSGSGGTGSDARIIAKDRPVFVDSAEAISRPPLLVYARALGKAADESLWIRMQNGTGAAPTNVSAAAVAFYR